MIVRIGAILSLLLAFSSSASAEEGWRFQVSPYLWAPSLSGSMTPKAGGPSYHSELSSKDILDRLDAAFFLTGSVRYDRFVLMGDFAHASLIDGETLAQAGRYSLGVEGKLNQTVATVTGGYTVFSRQGVGVDLMAGARLFSLDSSVRADLRANGKLVRRRTVSERLTWADPIVAARVHVDLLPRLSVIGYADLGGMDERFSWQALGAVNFRATDNLFLSVGYRHMSVDVGDGDSDLNVDLGGPLVGATLRF